LGNFLSGAAAVVVVPKHLYQSQGDQVGDWTVSSALNPASSCGWAGGFTISRVRPDRWKIRDWGRNTPPNAGFQSFFFLFFLFLFLRLRFWPGRPRLTRQAAVPILVLERFTSLGTRPTCSDERWEISQPI